MTLTRLLYVDSDPVFCVFYQALLRSYGFVVDIAASGVAAMERFNSSEVHAVMISHDLRTLAGKNDGFHLAAEIKRLAPAIPVVIVSSCESVVEDALYFVDGAISKSAPWDRLIRLMRWLTSDSASRRASVLPGGLQGTRELRRAATPAIAN